MGTGKRQSILGKFPTSLRKEPMKRDLSKKPRSMDYKQEESVENTLRWIKKELLISHHLQDLELLKLLSLKNSIMD
jgi:hypothetical protein